MRKVDPETGEIFDDEPPKANGQAQAGEGYGCKCGFKTLDVKQFRGHIMRSSSIEGKGTHVSIGRVRMDTGDVTMPPYEQRTPAQQHESRYAQKVAKMPDASRTTPVAAQAMEIRFVPRIFQATYTPIMRMAQECAIREWKWDINMPLEDFLDTVLYHFFKDRGYVLAGYIKEEDGGQEGMSSKLPQAEEEPEVKAS